VSSQVEDYWFAVETSIVEKRKKGEELFTDEEFSEILITTVAKQRLKFKEKGCQVQ
jgi:hypothetical protein